MPKAERFSIDTILQPGVLLVWARGECNEVETCLDGLVKSRNLSILQN